MVVPLAFFLIAWAFPIYLNIFKGKQLDAYRESKVGLEENSFDPDSRLGSIGQGNKDLEAARMEVKGY
jgi:FHS family L-fucose permease-like MFS transporter